MANPYKPNTAPIPNIIFDYWMAQLTPAEFKILMAIARKTYGWHKQRDRISIRQMVEMTGLHKNGVIKATERLVELKLVIKIKSKDEFDGSDAPNQYEINTECEADGAQNNEGGSTYSRHPPVHTVDTPRVHSVDTQKTLSTKDTIQKKEADKPPTSPPPRRKKIQEEMEEVAPRVWFTPSQKLELLKKVKGDHEKVKKIFERLSDWKISENIEGGNDFRTILKWVIKAVEEDELKKNNQNSCSARDSVMAEKIWNRFKGRSQKDIILCSKYIEFIQGVNAPSTVLEFGSKNFRENCLEQLRKRRLNTEGL